MDNWYEIAVNILGTVMIITTLAGVVCLALVALDACKWRNKK